MATNQGLLQAQIKVKNTIDLNNAFSSPSVANPQLKSIEGDLNLSNEYALQSFNSSNTNTQHIDTIRTNSSNTSLKEALNNLPNLKYVRLEGNYESKGNSFDNNTNLQKVDLSESLQVKPEDFKANESLKTLPNLDYSNPDLTDIITNDTELKPTTFDISNEPNTNKLGIHGDSTHQLENLEFVKVNPEAPFDDQITPQIDVSYTSLDRNGLVNLFNTMPYNVGYTVVGNPTITDGIASGFSTSNFLKISNFDTSKDFEIQIIFSQSQTSATQYRVFCLNSYDFIVREIGNSVSVYIQKTEINFSFNQNDKIGVKVIKTGTNMNVYSSINGSDWLLQGSASYTNTSIFTAYLSDPYQPFTYGSIDLNKTYIKVNSITSTGPVGYTVVGSPTITHGIASGFSNSNYLSLSTAFNPQSSNFEIFLKIKTANSVSDEQHIFTSQYGTTNATRYGFLVYTKNKKLTFNNTTNGSSWTGEISGNTVLSSDTEYYIRAVHNNSILTISLSTDKINWNVEIETTYTAPSIILAKTYLGTFLNYEVYQGFRFLGSIDLNNTYIKVNGKLWFGHESKQVTWFNGKPSQIKVVDISGATGTSSLTNDDKAIVTNKGWRLVTDGSNSKNYTIEDGNLVWADPRIYTLNTQNGGGNAGRSVCFNAGFIPTNKTTYEISFDRLHSTDGSSEMNASPFRITSAKYDETSYKGFGMSLQNLVAVSYFGQEKVAAVSYAELFNGVKKVLKSTLTGNGYNVTITQNGIVLDTLSFDIVEDQTCFGNLYLGCWNYGYSDGRTPPVRFYPFLGKIYYAKFWENGVLIRHFVPIVQGAVIGNFTVPSNGMFDIVNQQFYANKGTGEFTYGWDL